MAAAALLKILWRLFGHLTDCDEIWYTNFW
jgi:hypothetical protein